MVNPKVPAVEPQAHLQSSEATTTFERRSPLLRKVCPLLVCVPFRQKKTKLLFLCGDLGVIPKAWQTQFLEGWTSTRHSDLSKNGQMGVRAEEWPLQDPVTTRITEAPLRSGAASLALLGENPLPATRCEKYDSRPLPTLNPTYPPMQNMKTGSLPVTGQASRRQI